MKTARNIITVVSLALILVSAFSACKKDNSSDNNPDGSGKGSYTYGGRTTNSTRGDFLSADGNLYLFVYGQEATDIVQFIFTKKSKLEPGDYTFKAVGNGYNPAVNFSGGSVTSAKSPAGDAITGGKINIAAKGDQFEVAMDVTTTGGALKGTYNGGFVSR